MTGSKRLEGSDPYSEYLSVVKLMANKGVIDGENIRDILKFFSVMMKVTPQSRIDVLRFIGDAVVKDDITKANITDWEKIFDMVAKDENAPASLFLLDTFVDELKKRIIGNIGESQGNEEKVNNLLTNILEKETSPKSLKMLNDLNNNGVIEEGNLKEVESLLLAEGFREELKTAENISSVWGIALLRQFGKTRSDKDDDQYSKYLSVVKYMVDTEVMDGQNIKNILKFFSVMMKVAPTSRKEVLNFIEDEVRRDIITNTNITDWKNMFDIVAKDENAPDALFLLDAFIDELKKRIIGNIGGTQANKDKVDNLLANILEKEKSPRMLRMLNDLNNKGIVEEGNFKEVESLLLVEGFWEELEMDENTNLLDDSFHEFQVSFGGASLVGKKGAYEGNDLYSKYLSVVELMADKGVMDGNNVSNILEFFNIMMKVSSDSRFNVLNFIEEEVRRDIITKADITDWKNMFDIVAKDENAPDSLFLLDMFVDELKKRVIGNIGGSQVNKDKVNNLLTNILEKETSLY